MTKINYPYMSRNGAIDYVELDNKFMAAAKEVAKNDSFDKLMPNGTVIVLNGKIIGHGANGSNYHNKFGCERVKRGIPTGLNYELCEGCHPKNHGEPKAIKKATEKGYKTTGAEVYLWGHWWCCKPCWRVMHKAGIRKVYLLKNSEKLFNKAHPKNIVGSQFESGKTIKLNYSII